ncbi:MAG: acetate--CoA ligase family protein, partial [Polyangiales bacterium]
MFCDCPELAVDVARDAARIGLSVEPEVHERPWERVMAVVGRGGLAGLAVEKALGPDTAVRLSELMRTQKQKIPVAVIGPQPLGLLHDLGLPAVHETGPLTAVAALLELETERPWAATTKELPAVDRVRLGESVSHRSDGRFVRIDDGLIAHQSDGAASKPIGAPRDVAEALRAMRASQDPSRPKVPSVQGVEADSVLEVLLGPKRALSDPASKAALGPYDVPLPLEELCATPSRTASEAARIGFPVRVALASPDLRLWDHPDLAAEVFSAGQARDAFHQILAVAKTRSEDARLLGVTVSASTMARTMLRVRMEPLRSGPVLAEIGFADPHGRASADKTQTVLPATGKALERVLLRLQGSSLLLAGAPQERAE